MKKLKQLIQISLPIFLRSILLLCILSCLLEQNSTELQAQARAPSETETILKEAEIETVASEKVEHVSTLPDSPTSPNQAANELMQVPAGPIEINEKPKSKDLFSSSVETTLFDIYLGDKLKGAVLADYSDDWLEISDPNDVIDQLKDLKGANRLIPLIEGKINKQREILELGRVHFDLNTFSIIIDVDPKFLNLTALNLKNRIGDPDNAPSLQQRVGIISSGSTQGQTNSAFSHRGIASYGKFFALADGAFVSERPYELNQAVAGGIIEDYRGTGGLLQTQGSSFSPSLQYTGVKFETAQDLFLDQDLIRGSKFQVFVPTRSRVEFYRDGRLISVQVLDFGLREIDTTSFPQGSYDVDIVIIDSFGNPTRQRKFFTKAGFLASRSQPIFSLQAGSIRDNLDSQGNPVYQGGVRWRATDIFDLNTSLYGSEDLQIATLETVGLYRDVRFGFGYNESNENDRGVTSNLGTIIWDTNFTLNYNKTLQGGVTPEVVPPGEERPFDPVFDLPNRATTLTFQDRYMNSYTVSRRFGEFNIRYINERSSGDGTPSRFSKGPYLEWLPINNGDTTLRIQTSKLDTEQGDIVSAGVLVGYRISKYLVVASQLTYQEKDQGDETVLLTTIGYDDKDSNNAGQRAVVTNDIRSKKDETGTIRSISNQADLDLTGEYTQTIGFVRDVNSDNKENTAYGVNASSTFLLASDGSASVSHPVTREAVLIAEVESTSTESEFEVLMDDQVVATVKAGQKVVVAAIPFRTYDIKLRPKEGSDLVAYEANSSKVTVFPGNVIKRKWTVDKVFILIGRLIDENGAPIARHRIKGTREYTVTEEDGSFQAEISGRETLTIDSKQHHCKLSFDTPEDFEFFFDIGDIECSDGQKKP